MNKLAIYPETHPFIALMKSSNAIHLTPEQYEIVATSWLNGKPVKIENYLDPVTKRERPLMLDGYAIEIIDDAEEVQKEHWIKQGGYVCKYGTFHERREMCFCRPEKSPKQLADEQGDSGLSEPPETWNDTAMAWRKSNIDRMRDAYEKRNKEISEIYDDIEKHLTSYGETWCNCNQDKWEETANPSGAKINWYGIFFTRKKERAKKAISAWEAAQKEKAKTETTEVVDEIPF